jgi:hypothetical protein
MSHIVRAQDGERRRPPPREPSGDDSRADDVSGRREAEGDHDAVDERQLPEFGHEPGAGKRGPEHEGAEDGDRSRSPALDEPAHERHEQAVEEEAERYDEGIGGAVRPEIGDDGLQEGADREADAGREEHHDGEGDGDPPSVEHPSTRHRAGHYSRGVERGQLAGCSREAKGSRAQAPLAQELPESLPQKGFREPAEDAVLEVGSR